MDIKNHIRISDGHTRLPEYLELALGESGHTAH